MADKSFKIGVVAVSSRFGRETADRVLTHVAGRYPGGEVSVVFHETSFIEHGHFAGDDAARAEAFVQFANDPRLDAVWFARGGYGSCRMAEAALPRLGPAARDKRYLGYSDAGSLMAGLYRAGLGKPAHGPMAADINRPGGEAAVDRALDWLTTGAASSLEPHVGNEPTAAFNITILSQLLGTELEPDLTGHVLMLEEVGEALYRIDRAMFHITGQPSIRRVAGIRLGRVSDVTPNDPDFGMTAEQIVADWCARAGIPYLGQADIGHDADNKVVPFGRP